MSERRFGFAVAGLVGVLSSGAPPSAAEPLQIGIDRAKDVVLRSEAAFGTTLIWLEILPDGGAADGGTAAGDGVPDRVPGGSGLAQIDGRWTRVGAGPVSGWLGPQIGAAPVAQAWDDGDGLSRGMLPDGAGWQLDGAAGEARPTLLAGMAGREGGLDPGAWLGDARCDLDQRQTDGVGAPERGRRRQATKSVQEPVGGGADQEAELLHLDAKGAIGDEAQLVRMIKFSAWPDWQ